MDVYDVKESLERQIATDHQASVRDFMDAMGQPIPIEPMVPSLEIQKLRASLVSEEANELIGCVTLPHYLKNDEERLDWLVQWIDTIADQLYVTYGSAIAVGLDIHPIFEIVHKANMLKLTGPRREDGKQLKPEGWVGPEAAIREEIKRQMSLNA